MKGKIFCIVLMLLMTSISFSTVLADDPDSEPTPKIPGAWVRYIFEESETSICRDGTAKIVVEVGNAAFSDTDVLIDWGDGETTLYKDVEKGVQTFTHKYDSDIGFLQLFGYQRWDGKIYGYDNYPNGHGDTDYFRVESVGILFYHFEILGIFINVIKDLLL
ncbi:MAG: hypothetical protein ACOC5T_08275 [Elusimicrobiota bacterium]